jgi:hypothetical protein
MKKPILVAISLLVTSHICAQGVLEILRGNKHAHYINYFDKDLDSSAKWNFFNLNRFTVNYEDKAINTVSIEGQLTYQIKPWLGISAGGGFYGELFVPAIGLSLSYMNKKEDLFIQLYPTAVFVEGQVAPSVLGLLICTPKFSKNWGLSSQILFSADPFEVAQIIRIGADYQEKIQFGIGVDMTQNFESKNLNFNFGPFVRFTF